MPSAIRRLGRRTRATRSSTDGTLRGCDLGHHAASQYAGSASKRRLGSRLVGRLRAERPQRHHDRDADQRGSEAGRATGGSAEFERVRGRTRRRRARPSVRSVAERLPSRLGRRTPTRDLDASVSASDRGRGATFSAMRDPRGRLHQRDPLVELETYSRTEDPRRSGLASSGSVKYKRSGAPIIRGNSRRRSRWVMGIVADALARAKTVVPLVLLCLASNPGHQPRR